MSTKNIAVLASAFLMQFATQAQVINDQVSMGPGNANMIFYSLENGEISQFDQASWDIAFDVAPMGSTALINTGLGSELYHYGSMAEWDLVDTAAIDTLTLYLNDHTAWANGAFSQGGDGMFQIGWGTYDVITHVVTGDNVYIQKLTDGSYKKVALMSLEGGAYEFKYANIDGSNENTILVDKADYEGKNFAFMNLATEEMHDIEPLEWDMVFMNYIVDFGGGFTYPVTGCLTNRGVTTQQSDELLDPLYDDALDTLAMSEDANIIGYDWKSYDMDAGEYVLETERCYFLTSANGAIYRVVFTGYGGSANGDIDMSIVLEVASDISVAEISNDFNIYPNPVTNGNLNIASTINGAANVTIYNAAGQVVVSEMVQSNFNKVDVNGLPSGFYSVVLRSDAVRMQKALIIE